MQGQPSGWYRDPDQPNRHRYWNGEQWTGPQGEKLAAARRRLIEARTSSRSECCPV